MTNKSQLHQNSNTLSLIRLQTSCKILPTRVDFSINSKLASTQTSITPTFNNDHRYFTSSFVLPVDNKYSEKNILFQKSKFEEKIQRTLEQYPEFTNIASNDGLYLIAPNTNHCQICQESFDDYFTHTNLKSHMNRLSNSQTAFKIRDLCVQFKESLKKTQSQSKIKNIKKKPKREMKVGKDSKLNYSSSASNLIKLRKNSQQINSKQT